MRTAAHGRRRRGARAVVALAVASAAAIAVMVVAVQGHGTGRGSASLARDAGGGSSPRPAAPSLSGPQPAWAADPALAVPRRDAAGEPSTGAAANPTKTASSSTTTTMAPATTTVVTTSTVPTATTVPATTTTSCAGALPAQLASTAAASQLVTVQASGYGTTWATLTAWSKSGSCWDVAYGPFTARLGWSGLEPASRKVEGDGGTPEGIYGFGPVMYGNAPDPGVRYPYHDLVCGDWWDEDPQSPDYNLFVHWSCGSTPPFAQGPEGAGSEALWTETGPYPAFAVIAYNVARVPGKGSAIFLHYGLASPTAGCVSIDITPLDEVLDWLNPSDSPAIVIGTAGDIRSY